MYINFAMQFYRSEVNFVLHYMDTDFFIYSRKLKAGTKNGNLEDKLEKNKLYDFCKVRRYPQLNCRVNENVLGKFKIEKLETVVIDNFCGKMQKDKHTKINSKKQKYLKVFFNGIHNTIKFEKHVDFFW